MGAGASKNSISRPVSLSTVTDFNSLSQPFTRGTDKFFYTIPLDEELQRKSPVLLLEVGYGGLRLLRPDTEDPLSMFPWGQVHSWTHGGNKFSFKFFDDGKRTILSHLLVMRDVEPLLAHISLIIEDILSQRKSELIKGDAYKRLLDTLGATPEGQRLDALDRATADLFLMSDQGTALLQLLPTEFDKVEGAVLLHGRLVDQNCFSSMLEVLASNADRENVWHRITVNKRASTTLSASKQNVRASRIIPATAAPGTLAGGNGPTSPVSPTLQYIRNSITGGGFELTTPGAGPVPTRWTNSEGGASAGVDGPVGGQGSPHGATTPIRSMPQPTWPAINSPGSSPSHGDAPMHSP